MLRLSDLRVLRQVVAAESFLFVRGLGPQIRRLHERGLVEQAGPYSVRATEAGRGAWEREGSRLK